MLVWYLRWQKYIYTHVCQHCASQIYVGFRFQTCLSKLQIKRNQHHPFWACHWIGQTKNTMFETHIMWVWERLCQRLVTKKHQSLLQKEKSFPKSRSSVWWNNCLCSPNFIQISTEWKLLCFLHDYWELYIQWSQTADRLPQLPGRLFVCTEFFRLPNELRRGAHLCLTPSCSEPFGVSNPHEIAREGETSGLSSVEVGYLILNIRFLELLDHYSWNLFFV